MIEAIFITPGHNLELQKLPSCSVVKNKGIIGDRYFDKQNPIGQNISFIAIESIQDYNQKYQQAITAEQTRRNIITKGLDLNSLIGKEFTIGDIHFKGIELCQPCLTLSKQLANDTIDHKSVSKALTDRAGIRATVLTNGELQVRMNLESVR